MRCLPCLLLLACVPPKAPADAPVGPPVAPVRSHVHTEHGVERADPYFWMLDRDDPAVRAYVEAENAWTRAATVRLEPLRVEILAELEARVAAETDEPPVRVGPYEVWERYDEGADYPMLVRRREGAPEELVVDWAALAEGHDQFDGDVVAWSVDHRLVAVGIDTEGDEIYDLRFRDLSTGAWLPDEIPAVVWGGGFSNDGRSFLYTRADESLRPSSIHRHVFGEAPSADALVYREDDRRFSAWLSKTRSDAYFTIESESYSTSEIRVLDAATAQGPSRVLVPRREGVVAHVDHQGDGFVVWTDHCPADPTADCAPGMRVLWLPLDADDLDDGREVVPHRDGVTIEGVLAFDAHLVVLERREGAVRPVIRGADGSVREVALPEAYYELEPDENPDADAKTFRFRYRSLSTPDSVFAVDLATGDLELLWQQPVPDWKAQDYEVRRVWATSADGTSVPLTFVRRADAPEGPGPALLYGYGAYGVHVDPWFESERASLLRRGVTFALCAVRGGGDLGRPWYLDGKLDKKHHSFEDFVGCAEYLVRAGLTTPEQLGITGLSAGGLLMGGALNLRPDLFGAAVVNVPFVDVVTTMLDDTLPLTAEEWEEWGDPHREADFRWMLAYSPYDNVAARDYPPMFVTAGWNDTSVLVHEPTKWVAKIRALAPGTDVLLSVDMDSGHAGDSGRFGALDQVALEQAWLLDRLGVASP